MESENGKTCCLCQAEAEAEATGDKKRPGERRSALRIICPRCCINLPVDVCVCVWVCVCAER